MTDVQQYKSVRGYLASRCDEIETNGDAVDLALDLTYCLAAIMLGMSDYRNELRREIHALLSDESLAALLASIDETAH